MGSVKSGLGKRQVMGGGGNQTVSGSGCDHEAPCLIIRECGKQRESSQVGSMNREEA